MQRMFKQTAILSATAAIAILFTACGETKVTQCHKIIKLANQAATLNQELSTNSKSEKGSKSLTEAAGKIDKIASEMKAVEVKDEKLQGFQGHFLKLYQDTSKALRDTASAFDKKNLKAATGFIISLKNATNQETAIVSEINGYCSGK